MSESEPSPQVEPHETIVRYCVHKSDMRVSEGKVAFKRLLPPKNFRMSVVRSLGLEAAEVQAIGRGLLDSEANRIKGHASIGAAAFQQHGLAIEPDPTPHPRHANVVGWRCVEEEDRAIAIALAEVSALTRY